jgi:hypothetical protein
VILRRGWIKLNTACVRFRAKIDGRGLGEYVGQSSKCTAAVLISFQVRMSGKGLVERPEKSCEEGGMLGGHPGLVTSHARSGTPARRSCIVGSSKQLGMSYATRHFATTETCLPFDTADIRSPVSRVFIAMGK